MFVFGLQKDPGMTLTKSLILRVMAHHVLVALFLTCVHRCDPSVAACRAGGRGRGTPGPRPGARSQAVCTPASAPGCSEAECSG